MQAGLARLLLWARRALPEGRPLASGSAGPTESSPSSGRTRSAWWPSACSWVHSRRPLSGHADLLRRAADRESVRAADLRESVDVILQAATGGAETVKRLLTFAPTNPDAETRQVNLDTLLREVAQLTAPRWRDATQAEGRPISLHVESAGNVSICGQPASLREALTNLVFNAVDALPRGGTICLARRMTPHRRSYSRACESWPLTTSQPWVACWRSC